MNSVPIRTINADEVVVRRRWSVSDTRLEVALMLFEQGYVGISDASRLAWMDEQQFQRLLARRHIPLPYDMALLEVPAQLA